MNWRTQRRKDREAQKEYFESHQFCGVCLAEGRGKRLAQEVHEIIFRSHQGKCIPENMVSLCRSCHQKCHGLVRPKIEKEYLREIKGIC